jgi:hypothetical protein
MEEECRGLIRLVGWLQGCVRTEGANRVKVTTTLVRGAKLVPRECRSKKEKKKTLVGKEGSKQGETVEVTVRLVLSW